MKSFRLHTAEGMQSCEFSIAEILRDVLGQEIATLCKRLTTVLFSLQDWMEEMASETDEHRMKRRRKAHKVATLQKQDDTCGGDARAERAQVA